MAAIAPRYDERIIEVGPGRGALTFALADRVGRLLAVEMDRSLARALRDAAVSTLDTLEGNFLDLDLDTLAQRVGDGAGPTRIVGNLPYNVSAPILLHVLRGATRAGIRDAVFMLQREVAARVVAGAGSRDYGPLAVMTALRADAQILFHLPPGAFRPVPKIHSTLVALRFRDTRRQPTDAVLFESVVRGLFTHRRKQLVNALAPIAASRHVDPRVCCRHARLEPQRRPGELTLTELIDLSEVMAQGQV